jgi:mRNA interferase RelE/StbE
MTINLHTSQKKQGAAKHTTLKKRLKATLKTKPTTLPPALPLKKVEAKKPSATLTSLPNLAWSLDYTPKALKQLEKLNPSVQQRVVEYLEDKVLVASDPREHAKALTGEYKGLYRFKIAKDYRVLVYIQHHVRSVTVLGIGHRRKVYR